MFTFPLTQNVHRTMVSSFIICNISSQRLGLPPPRKKDIWLYRDLGINFCHRFTWCKLLFLNRILLGKKLVGKSHLCLNIIRLLKKDNNFLFLRSKILYRRGIELPIVFKVGQVNFVHVFDVKHMLNPPVWNVLP